MSDPDLHITVVAFTVAGGMELTDEIALSKAALLYADRVTLASPKVMMLASIAGYLSATPEQRREILMEMAAGIPGGAEMLSAWRTLRVKKHRSGPEIVAMKQAEKHLERIAADMAAKIEEILATANAAEIERAMQAGVLELDTLGAESVSDPLSNDGIVAGMTELIGSVLSPTSTTYPMFSELTGGLARAMVNDRVTDRIDAGVGHDELLDRHC